MCQQTAALISPTAVPPWRCVCRRRRMRSRCWSRRWLTLCGESACMISCSHYWSSSWLQVSVWSGQKLDLCQILTVLACIKHTVHVLVIVHAGRVNALTNMDLSFCFPQWTPVLPGYWTRCVTQTASPAAENSHQVQPTMEFTTLPRPPGDSHSEPDCGSQPHHLP